MTRIPIPPDPSWCVLRNMTVVILMAVLVAGCPAGGGGGAGIIIPAFNVPDLPIVAPATSFETPEFATNSGLDQINAQHAYARNGTGVGVVVGVVDSGIDPAQPDLDANISPSSIDIVSPATPIADTGGHGTAVAGVIAAEKNNVDMHGVAFNATILAVRADAPGLCVSLANCSFFTSDVAAGIDYARENGAKVINLSLGAPGPVSALIRNAIIAAAQAGIIVVAAAGNDSSTVPSAPASLAGDPATLGLMLAVGAVDSANNLASFSNQCGASAQFCLVAPGVGIVTTALTSDPTSTITVSGTSFSAPHIAGAAALLLQMFPTLTPAQVVQLLLQTATALGAETVFGQGLVNLAAAVLPQGIPEVVLGGASSGFSIPLEQTQLQLGAAFGDALVNNATLKNAIYLDSYNRAYVVDLTQYITPATRSLNLESAIAKNNYHSVELPTPDGMSVRFGYSDDPRTLIASDPDQRTSFNTSIESLGSPSYNMDVSVRVSHNTSAWFGANATSDNVFAKPRAMLGRRLFWSSEEMLTPGSTLIAPGDGFAVNRTLNGSTSVSLGFFRSDGWDDDEIPGGEGSMATATIGRSFHSGIESSAAFGIVEEDQTFLGSDPDGAYGDNGGTTQFAALLASFPIHRSVEAFASATVGLTDVVSGAPNLLEDWSEVYSDAFGVGLVARNVAVERDRLGFLVGQPLRVSDASATLTAPVGQEASGQIIHQSERVDLSPSGREIDFQIAYNRDVWTRAELSAWLMARLEPGHDETAEPDYGLGAKLEIKF